MSQSAIASARIFGPQTGQQALEQEIIATFPNAFNLPAGINSTGFVAFQCFFTGSLRGVLLFFSTLDNTINIPNCEIRRGVAVLPASPTEAQVSPQGGVAQILPGPVNPLSNVQNFDFTNAYAQGDLAIFPGDVLFTKWNRFAAGAATVGCGCTWRYGRNPRRMF
jgi:hypothetical protein